MATKRCEECGYNDLIKGCRLVSANCINTASRPSFMKPDNIAKAPKLMTVKPSRKVKTSLGKMWKGEDKHESFGVEDKSLKSGQEYGIVDIGDEGTLN